MKQPFKILLVSILLLHSIVGIMLFIKNPEQLAFLWSVLVTVFVIIMVILQGPRKPVTTHTIS